MAVEGEYSWWATRKSDGTVAAGRTMAARTLPASPALATAAGGCSTSDIAVHPTMPAAASVAATAQAQVVVVSTTVRRGASTVGSAARRAARLAGMPHA